MINHRFVTHFCVDQFLCVHAGKTLFEWSRKILLNSKVPVVLLNSKVVLFFLDYS